MRDHRGSRKTNRKKSDCAVENSNRITVVAFLALVALLATVVFIVLNFWLSGNNEINPSTGDLAKVSGSKDQKEQLALRSPKGGTEASQIGAAFKAGKDSQKLKTDQSNILQPGQKSTTARLDDQQDTQPDGQPIDQYDIQSDRIPNEQIEDEIDDEAAEEMEDELDDEMDEEQADDPGEFSISGWVFTQAGEPVPWIQLTAMVRQLFQENSSWASAETGREQRSQTDADGFFSFRQLADGEYDVRTRATERYSSARALLRAGTASATLIVKEEEEKEVYVYGIVESTGGSRLEGVRVLPIGQKQATTTDQTGNYELNLTVKGSRQNYPFRFLQQGYREQRPTLGSADVLGFENVRLDVIMEPIEMLTTVTGTVTGSEGLPVGGAAVQLLSTSLQRSYRVGTNLDGDFIIPEVEIAADYRLWVRPQDRYKDYIESGLQVPATGLDLTIVLELQGLSSLKGQMVDLNGKPVSNFSMWLRSASATVPPALPVTGDGLGYFYVDELPAGEVSFQTNSFPYVSVSGIKLVPGVEEYVRLTLDWGNYKMHGYVLNSEDEPVPGAQVSLLWQQNHGGLQSRSKRKTVADAGGYFLFEQLGPGLHTLNVAAPGFTAARLEHNVGTPGAEVLIQLASVKQ